MWLYDCVRVCHPKEGLMMQNAAWLRTQALFCVFADTNWCGPHVNEDLLLDRCSQGFLVDYLSWDFLLLVHHSRSVTDMDIVLLFTANSQQTPYVFFSVDVVIDFFFNFPKINFSQGEWIVFTKTCQLVKVSVWYIHLLAQTGIVFCNKTSCPQ